MSPRIRGWNGPQSAGRLATQLTTAYALSAGIYILVSGRIAEALSPSQEVLARIEATKGIAFVIITSVLLWFLMNRTLRRVIASENEVDELRRQFVEGERQATSEVIGASIVHDIRNILVVLDHLSSVLKEETDNALYVDLAAVSKRLYELTQRIDSSRGSEDRDVENCDLVQLVRETVQIAGSHRSVGASILECDLPHRLEFLGFPLHIHQALMNMILNAAEASPGGRRIQVSLQSLDGDLVRLDVGDDGPGVPEDERERILDPFISSKSRGSGLGMVSVRACAMVHGGRIRIGSAKLGGALVSLEMKNLL